jgi:hypothetical protein
MNAGMAVGIGDCIVLFVLLIFMVVKGKARR